MIVITYPLVNINYLYGTEVHRYNTRNAFIFYTCSSSKLQKVPNLNIPTIYDNQSNHYQNSYHFFFISKWKSALGILFIVWYPHYRFSLVYLVYYAVTLPVETSHFVIRDGIPHFFCLEMICSQCYMIKHSQVSALTYQKLFLHDT